MKDAPHRSAALTSACDAASFVLLMYIVISRVFYAEFGLDVVLDAGRLLLILVVAALLVLRRWIPRLDPRATVGALAALSTGAACLMILPAAGVDLSGRIRSIASPITRASADLLYRVRHPAAIRRLDDRYGYVHVPGASDWERGRGFTVTYTIDEDGHRTTPRPAEPRGAVVFLGDSMTFGWGVEDNEAYPFVIASEHWRDIRVVNGAVDGWGLTQCHLALTDLLARLDAPDTVILAIIADDLRRSHLRPPLIPGQRRRLEWIDGAFVPRTLADASRILLQETPALLEQEARQAGATLEAMSHASRARGVRFAVVLLGDELFPPDVIYALARDRVPTLDLTRLRETTLPDDVHPDPAGHRTIATAVAASFLTPFVYGDPAATTAWTAGRRD